MTIRHGTSRGIQKTFFITQFGILLAIEALFCFTPLGSLPALGPIVATLAMIPVIVTSLLLGTKAGALMGAFTGLFSFIVWTFLPPIPISAFVFTPFYSLGEFQGNFGSLLICFVPRVLVGIVAGVSYKSFSKAFPNKKMICFSVSGALGSLMNTFGVVGGIWLFFGNQYSSLVGNTMIYIIGLTIVTSGIPEAVISAVIAAVVCKPLKTVLSQNR